MLDLTLAVAHHLLVFGLAIMLATELSLLRAPTIHARRLAMLDGGYGATAGLVAAVGAARVVWGARGWGFYAENPFFWGKVGVFAAIALMSIKPTITFLRWARAAKADPAFQPSAREVSQIRRWVGAGLWLLFPLVALAAAMARWPL